MKLRHSTMGLSKCFREQIKPFGKNMQGYIWHKKDNAHHYDNIIPAVMYGGRKSMIWTALLHQDQSSLQLLRKNLCVSVLCVTSVSPQQNGL